MNKKNILIISHDLSLSGAPLLLFSLAKELYVSGYFITITSPFDGELKEEYLKIGIPVIIDDSLYYSNTNEFKRFMANFDLVIANTILNWRIILSAKETSTPSIWYIHESTSGLEAAQQNILIKKALSVSDKVVFPCKYTTNMYQKIFHTKQSNFLTIYTGLEINKYTPNKSFESPSSDNKIQLIHIGSIEERKGQDILIDAINKIPKEIQNKIEIKFVGRILDEKYYKLIQKKIISDVKIEFTKQLPHERVLELLKKSDIFILTSRDEVFPLTILEAMSQAKAIIAPNITGIPEAVQSNISGYLYDNLDINQLKKQIIQLVNDKNKRNKLGERAKKEFEKKFTIKLFSEKFIEEIDNYLEV